MDGGFQGWALLELMGHRQRPGYVRETELAGAKVLRVDIPMGKDDADQDRMVIEYYTTSALFALRPGDEATIREQALMLYGAVEAYEPTPLLETPPEPY
jgi:hypothetical protein